MALRILAAQSTKYANLNPDTAELASSDRWKNIAQAVEELTDVSMGSKDRLRQFAMGYPDSNSPTGRTYAGLGRERLLAVAEFLTDPHASTAPLPKIELEEFQPDAQAPLYLLEYLYQYTMERTGIRPEQLLGTYVSNQIAGNRATAWTLTAEAAVQDGAVVIVLFEDQYLLTEEEAQRPNAAPVLSRPPDQTFRYKGWAVLSAEDSIVVFLKREKEGANHLLISLAYNGSVFFGDDVQVIVLQNQLYPLELGMEEVEQEDSKILAAIKSSLVSKMLVFRRKL